MIVVLVLLVWAALALALGAVAGRALRLAEPPEPVVPRPGVPPLRPSAAA